MMEIQRKLSLRRVEMSLTKFNEVAVPHHLDLLRQHKHNIAKFSEAGELNRVRSEQLNARRLVTQLRNLLSEMEQLRRQVKEEELDKFDRLTQNSRHKTLEACADYLEHPSVHEVPGRREAPAEAAASVQSTLSTESIGTVLAPSVQLVVDRSELEEERLRQKEECLQAEHEVPARREAPAEAAASVQSTLSTESIGTVLAPSVQLVVDRSELEEERLRQKEECLQGWEELQSEVQDLYEVYAKFQQVVEEQKSHVDMVADNVDETAANVDLGRRSLAKTERLKFAMYPIAGALIGGCLAGPIGLVAGIKVASAALIGGSILGFTGGSFLKRKQETRIDGAAPNVLEKDENGESKKDK